MRNRNTKIASSFIILGATVIAIFLISIGGKTNVPSTGSHLGNLRQQISELPNLTSLEDDDPILGDPNAPVTLVEFGDYQCTFCTRFFKETEPILIEKYVKTGKLKMVFRDFVINGRESQNAAEAAQCAGEQGKYWEYHNRLYSERRGYNVGTFKEENLKRFAQELGLDTEQFNKCYDSGKYRDEISKDYQDALRFGSRGTPTFYLNGKQLVGALPSYVFEQAIEQLLQETN